MTDMNLLEIDPQTNGLTIAEEDYISTTWKKTAGWLSQARASASILAPLVEDVPTRALDIKDKIIVSVDSVGSTLPDVLSPVTKFFNNIFD